LYKQLGSYGYHVILNRTGDYALSDENSYMLADIFQYWLNEFYNSRERPQKGALYYLLNHSVCPTVIVEMGCISNEQDRAILTNHTRRKQLASTICTAVNEYFQLVGEINSPPNRRIVDRNLETMVARASTVYLAWYYSFLK
jgi:hypothetical protein